MVTPEHLRQYKREGYTICQRVVEPALLEEMTEHINNFVAATKETIRPEHLDRPHGWDKRFLDFCATPSILDQVEQFIGPNIVLFASHLICKMKGDGLEVPWHQDAIYWPLEPMNVITLWLAIDDSTVENGCMKVIPGTHKLGPLQHGNDPDAAHKVLHLRLEPELLDESKVVNCVLKRGDASFHAPYTVHGSTPNTSPYRRCGYTMRYMPVETKLIRTGPMSKYFWNHPLYLLRGKDTQGSNVYANV